MGVYNESKCTRLGIYGVSVSRDADNLPADDSAPIFNVVGGRVAITQIIGVVTEAIEDQANDTKLTTTPTDGVAADLCAALDIAADTVGTIYGITGTPANAMVGSTVLTKQATQLIVGEGTIDLECAAANTGAIQWTIYYIAMDDGAVIEAAEAYTTTAGA